MKPICLIMPYMGNFRPSIVLFLESCRRNPEIDWILFTDNAELKDLPKNVRWVNCTLHDIERLAERKLGRTVRLPRAYKLCDLKPFYGVVFEEYLTDYEYWGFGDVDVIYGHVWDYLQRIDWKRYDRINSNGHFALVRNTPECCRVFERKGSNTVDMNTVLADGELNYGIDERDIVYMMRDAKMRVYDGIISADIDPFYERMRCADSNTMIKICKFEQMSGAFPVNYRKQCFVLRNGGIYRYFIRNGAVHRDEFAYIHFRVEAPIKLRDQAVDSFLITRGGFYDLDEYRLDEVEYLSTLIREHNLQEGPMLEYARFLYQSWRYRPVLKYPMKAVQWIGKKTIGKKGTI